MKRDRFSSGFQRSCWKPRPQHREARGKRVPRVFDRNSGPEECRDSVAPVRATLFNGQVHQQGEVLLGPEPNRFAVRSEENRLAQAAKVVLGRHIGSLGQGSCNTMQYPQPIVNAMRRAKSTNSDELRESGVIDAFWLSKALRCKILAC